MKTTATRIRFLTRSIRYGIASRPSVLVEDVVQTTTLYKRQRNFDQDCFASVVQRRISPYNYHRPHHEPEDSNHIPFHSFLSIHSFIIFLV